MIRQYAVPHDQVVQVTVPKEFNDKQVEIQIILVEEPTEQTDPRAKGGLGYLVGKYKHYTKEQNEKIDHDFKAMRDS